MRGGDTSGLVAQLDPALVSADAIRRVRGAELVVFENSGHFMWLEEPDRLFPLVSEWLASH